MRLLKRALCLCLCILCMVGAAVNVLAADGISDAFGEFFEKYDGLLDGVVDSLEDLTTGKALELSGAVSDKLEKYDLSSLGSDLKELLNETEKLSDAELDTAIRTIADAHQIRLEDSQVQQLRDLCRTLEKLSPEQLQERVDKLVKRLKKAGDGMEKLDQAKDKLEDAKEKLEQGKDKLAEQGKEKLDQGKEKAGGFLSWLKEAFQKLSDVFRRLFRLSPQPE